MLDILLYHHSVTSDLKFDIWTGDTQLASVLISMMSRKQSIARPKNIKRHRPRADPSTVSIVSRATAMFTASALLAFVLAGVAIASPLASTTFRVHELRPAVPSGFTEVGPASPQTTLNLRLALAQSDPDGLVDALYRVSDPDSEAYGQYLSKEEVRIILLP